MLREMVSLPQNKHCFDCNQRGPTYVNMTIGSFVCTSCSGILRGLNPPHRIKSISMASFTPEEMNFLMGHGNELNRKVYLGQCEGNSYPELDSREEQKVKELMVQKYESKRWYVAPTAGMKDEARWANETALNNKPVAQTHRNSIQYASASHTLGQVSVPQPGVVRPTPPISTPAPFPVAVASTPTGVSSGFDLLGELGGDLFSSSATNKTEDGFADFSNFDAMSSSSSNPPLAVPSAQVMAPHMTQGLSVSNPPSQLQSTSQVPAPATAPQPPPLTGGDRYAALADLDNVFSAVVTTTNSVSWDGLDHTSNWGDTNGSKGTHIQSTAGSNWASQGPQSATFNWNGQGSAGFATAASTGFGPQSSGPGLFGGAPAAAFSPFSGTAATSAANPFGGSAPMTQFSQVSMQGQASFGGQLSGQGQPPRFGQVPAMQNGGFGAMSTTTGYGDTGAVTQHNFMIPAQSGVAPHSSDWGQQGSVQPSQSVFNPFMDTSRHQVPPPSGSTNPFL